jgi:hypothetical protein
MGSTTSGITHIWRIGQVVFHYASGGVAHSGIVRSLLYTMGTVPIVDFVAAEIPYIVRIGIAGQAEPRSGMEGGWIEVSVVVNPTLYHFCTIPNMCTLVVFKDALNARVDASTATCTDPERLGIACP